MYTYRQRVQCDGREVFDHNYSTSEKNAPNIIRTESRHLLTRMFTPIHLPQGHLPLNIYPRRFTHLPMIYTLWTFIRWTYFQDILHPNIYPRKFTPCQLPPNIYPSDIYPRKFTSVHLPRTFTPKHLHPDIYLVHLPMDM